MESSDLSQPTNVERLRRQLSNLMTIERVHVQKAPDRMIAFYGDLYDDPQIAFEDITERFEALGYTAMLSHADAEDAPYQVVAARGVSRPEPSRRWLNVVLFAGTVVTTIFTGALNSTEFDLLDPMSYIRGLPFAAAVLAILVAHELAHYFVARRYGSPVSLPYFVPMPLSPFGTMGAVILQRAPMRDRKALFDIGVAGPLAGLIVTIPLLILGLSFSEVGKPSDFMEIQENMAVTQEGNSLLYMGAKYLVFGEVLPNEEGEDVWLTMPASPGGPVTFAAWAGMLVTAINLLPIGQLDGGHVAYALLGRWAWKLAYATVGLLGALGIYLAVIGNLAAGTWIVWALLGLLLGPRHPPPLNDVTKVGRGRIVLGIVVALILIVTFVPVPLVPAG